jgi:eukaryotic-like serine/threonine-protein kinase
MARKLIADRYRLERRLGAGGMSEVWLADDRELDRQVVVKFLGPGADAARFEREARAAAALAHTNICQLYDYGAAEGRPFMVLEYLPGGTLEERLRTRRPLPDEETTRILTQLANALAHAHERGLIHRDLKPANILFDAEGRAKIADFGIARLGEAATLTEAGTMLGTAAYISPEQAAGERATPASDVYSFGVIAYRMLTGRPLFESDSPFELARLHREAEPPPLAVVRPDAPPLLASVTRSALAKEPHERPADGAALLAQLAGAEPPTVAMAAAAETQILRRVPSGLLRRRRLLLAAALAALLAGGAALAVLITRSPSSKPARLKTPSTGTPTTHATTAATTTPTTTPMTAASTTAPTTTAPPATSSTTATIPPLPTTTPSVPTSLPTTTTAATTAPTTTAPGG